MRLKIRDIADLKEGRKTLEEISKTHDGTNLFSSSNAKDCFEDFSEYAQKYMEEHENPLRDARLRYMGVTLSLDGIYSKDGEGVYKGERLSENEYQEIRDNDQVQEGHLISYAPQNSYGGKNQLHTLSGKFMHNDCLPPEIENENIWRLAHVDNNGEYLFRSVTQESESGYRVSLVRSDDFDYKTKGYNDDLMYYSDSEYRDNFVKFTNTYNHYSEEYYSAYEKKFKEIKERREKEWNDIYYYGPKYGKEYREEAKAQKEKIGILSQKEALKELGSYRQHMKDKGVFDDARKAGMRLIIEKTDRYDENRYFGEKIRRGP